MKSSETPPTHAARGATRRGLLVGACLAGGALEMLRSGAAAEAAVPPVPPVPPGSCDLPRGCDCGRPQGPMHVVGWAARRVSG